MGPTDPSGGDVLVSWHVTAKAPRVLGPARLRVRERVERARRNAAVPREEPALTQGQLAEREGVSGARVNQVLSIVRLERDG